MATSMRIKQFKAQLARHYTGSPDYELNALQLDRLETQIKDLEAAELDPNVVLPYGAYTVIGRDEEQE